VNEARMTALAVLEHEAKAAKRRLAYQDQDSRLTLAQGLAEYYAANAGRVTPPDALAPGSADLFRRHDICHVIFGLDTTMADEAMVDTRTMVSCDVGFRTYADYLRSNPDAQAIFKEVGYLRTAWETLKATPRLFRALTARNRRRWPWSPPASFMDRTLADLRAEFGIRVI
jgi:hypothetical protein